MQILRLHWRSLMPWDRSPDNHLTAAQRRDYLMASLSWFRDLLMLAFSLLLLVITGLLVIGSGFAVAPLAGNRSLLPMSLIMIATVCMTVDAAPLDDHVVSAGAAVAGHQPFGHLGHRAGLHRGDGPAGRRLPADSRRPAAAGPSSRRSG